MGFRCLEFSNCVRNWNKVINVIFVGSKLQLCQLEIPIFIYNLMCQSSLINSFSLLFFDLNRVASWNEAKLSFYNDHHFKFPNINIGLIFKFYVWQCKYVFLIVILKGTLFLMCLASHFDFESRKLIVGHRDIYNAKKMKFFRTCGG